MSKKFDLQKEVLCEKKSKEPRIMILLLDKNLG